MATKFEIIKYYKAYSKFLLFVLVFLLVVLFALYNEYDELVNSEKFQMATGIYFPSNDSFCVYIGEREWPEIMETCSHEYLHHSYSKHFK